MNPAPDLPNVKGPVPGMWNIPDNACVGKYRRGPTMRTDINPPPPHLLNEKR